jgi:hypothetical protein
LGVSDSSPPKPGFNSNLNSQIPLPFNDSTLSVHSLLPLRLHTTIPSIMTPSDSVQPHSDGESEIENEPQGLDVEPKLGKRKKGPSTKGRVSKIMKTKTQKGYQPEDMVPQMELEVPAGNQDQNISV